jgi:eukaryotic-like serine/threonine-protein kinase
MQADRWVRLEELYHQAAARHGVDREEFLARECAGDRDLHMQVESLLAEDDHSAEFLEEPALAIAARLAADEIPVLSGRTFGPYQVEELLGSGGMGDVYRARDTILGRDVAIKILPEAFNDDPERLARFQQEAQFLASLSHPNIAAIYGIHEALGLRGLVLELVDGETLDERLKRGPIPLHDVVRLARQIGDALDAAHQRNIVHRDLKPSNIKVTRDGVTKVLDFGLATSPPEEPHGLVRGTAAYMSPEQARGDVVDKRTDIWAFGCVLYEMIVGLRAFPGSSAEAAPDYTRIPSAIPAGVTALLKRCFEDDPKERRRDIGDVIVDLEEAVSRQPPAPAGPRAVWPIVLVSVLGLLVALSTFVAGWRIGGAQGRSAPPSAFPVWHKLTYERGYIHSARFGPGGETVLYSASWNGSPFQIFTTTTLSPESRALDLPPSGLLAMSPTGKLALALSCTYRARSGGCVGTIAGVPVLGGAPRRIAENVEAADWGPGETLAAVVGQRLEYPLGTRLHGATDLVRISPDGRRLVSADHQPDGSLAVVVRHGSQQEILSTGWTAISGLAWAADNNAVFVTGFGPDNYDDAVSRIQLDGTERSVLRAGTRLRVLDAAAPDRLIIDQSSDSRRTWLHDPSVSGGRRDLAWLGSSVLDALSDDGRLMLITVRVGPTLESGRKVESLYPIYVRPTDGSPATLIGEGYGRALSPDGRWALAATRAGFDAGVGSSLVLFPLGPGNARTLDRGAVVLRGRAANASFAGADRIVFDAEGKDGVMGTYVQSISGGPPTPVEHEPGQVISPVAPDGDRFISRRRDGTLWIATLSRRPATTFPLALRPNQIIRQWTNDGREVFVLTPEEHRWVLTAVDVKTGRSRPHAEIARDPLAERPGPNLRISRDGRTIVGSDTRFQSSLFFIEGVR